MLITDARASDKTVATFTERGVEVRRA
jgi:hypothetical protein